MPTMDEHRVQWAGIAPVRVEATEPTHRPWCWNRPPRPEGEWNARHGYHETLNYLLGMSDVKPRYRWRPAFSADRCAAWDCSPTEMPAPVRDRWDCRGCRWLPERGRVQYG